MRQSQAFIRTKRETPRGIKVISHQLLLKGDFIDQTMSGVYSLLPLGLRVFRKIENIIRKELTKVGVQELMMPLIHPASLWRKTDRFQTLDKELWRIKDRYGEDVVLAMTHEEAISAIAADTLKSYQELPVIVGQIQTKIRDEKRPRGGLLRLKEFVMQDAYSFDKDKKGLERSYQKIIRAYRNIFKRCSLKMVIVEASTGEMGGTASHEFMVLADAGEDKILICKDCGYKANVEVMRGRDTCPKCGKKMQLKRCIEVGHTFKLGTKYSKAFNIYFKDRKGRKRLTEMGCYGIGLERVMAAIVETHHDSKGIIWPATVSPFDVHLLCLQPTNKKVVQFAENLYKTLQKNNIDILYDDRIVSPGIKLNDADLIGIPVRLVVSEKTQEKNAVEFKLRSQKETELIKKDKVVQELLR